MSNTLFFVFSFLICSQAEPLYRLSRTGYNNIDDGSVDKIDINLNNNENLDPKLLYQKEISALKSRKLYFYDDSNKLVEASLDDDYINYDGDDEYDYDIDGDDDDNDEDDYDIDDDVTREEMVHKKLDRKVKFNLYTQKNRNTPSLLKVDDDDNLKNSGFDPLKETRIITHGWVNSKLSPACTLIRDAYLENGDFNVIVVDWSRISKRPYSYASRKVKKIGKYVALMIDFLVKNGMNLDTTTLVGHSLGAHIVGLAGYYSKGTVNFIVGLDPALPLFLFARPGSRISDGDARHVEIIHTNAGLLGFEEAIGHADFYPNGGKKQHGCLVDIGGACSHARSFQFFAESINTPIGFYGKKCKTYNDFKNDKCEDTGMAIMGGLKNSFAIPGTYYLRTNKKSPYAVGISI